MSFALTGKGIPQVSKRRFEPDLDSKAFEIIGSPHNIGTPS